MNKDPLDLDARLGKCKNRIYFVGVELEGGWDKLPPGTRPIRDGSIHFDPPELNLNEIFTPLEIDRLRVLTREGGNRAFTPTEAREFSSLQNRIQASRDRFRVPGIIGEIPSDPLDVKDVEKWVRKFYPPHVNKTCGLHVHLSFRSALTYQSLMNSASYQATILKYLGTWGVDQAIPATHPFWERIQSRSEHCQDKYWPDLQARATSKDYDKAKEGHRYTHVNYCWGQHSTLEIRTLPMFETTEQALSAIKLLLNVTNAYIVTVAKREEKFKAELSSEDEFFNEEIRECV